MCLGEMSALLRLPDEVGAGNEPEVASLLASEIKSVE